MSAISLADRRHNREALVEALLEAGAAVHGVKVRCPFHNDRHPSAGIYQDNTGSWRFACHAAHCSFSGDVWDVEARHRNMATADWIRAAGPKLPPLPKNGHKRHRDVEPAKTKWGHPETIERFIEAKIGRLPHKPYRYVNPETGHVDTLKYRIEPAYDTGKKDFKSIVPDGYGWRFGFPDKPYPLYNREGIRQAKRVVLTEGEKAAHALMAFGIAATTTFNGAGSRKAEHTDWTPLAGKEVILWPDKDAGGMAFMQDVERILGQLNPKPNVFIIESLPSWKEKDDAFDFIAGMGSCSWSEISEIVHTFIDEADPAGASRDVKGLIEDTIAGRRQAVPWPWRVFSQLTQALLPGTVTIVCGKPGSAKSFWLLQALVEWHRAGYKVAVFELEEKRSYHLNRVLAQAATNGNLTQSEWVKNHPEDARRALLEHKGIIDSFGPCIWDVPGEDVTLESLAEWVKQRAAEGYRIIAIDPVTAAATPDNRGTADTRFVNAIKRLAADFLLSVILITHPKQGQKKGRLDQDDLAGGAAYPRLTQTIVWLEQRSKSRTVEVHTNMGPLHTDSTHTLHIWKARNGTGANIRLAFEFKNLLFVEKGILIKEVTKDEQEGK